MVQAIENWAELSGVVRDVRPRPGSQGMSEVLLAVDGVRDVEGFPNLLTEAAGQELAVGIRTDRLSGVEPGARIHCRAQRAGPRTVVAHSDHLERD